ncbi:MerR family transcriptional regulator [Myceligenerans salitolerans]|uniref:MerR family DNA-binding transcriptional regulator n=1 Tax=Myceligenerans salitolerans TaxID=1230528 RepID=A0ABS3I4B6_9MICO|nr:MerR family transcriptional regulator [Myceligenerans salitolerans]MBO0607840.1 MerR family DNA-binding transcriptional regulator [Myceligenerans salitolerans]
MAWSTRELADLAGTTVNAIRHYHALGLLDEPPRTYNGYKQYGVRDLVNLLRLRRLAGLGLPLAEIGTTKESDATEALRRADTVLREEIERFRRSRAGIAALLRSGAPVDTPPGFEVVGARLAESDRALIHVCTRIHPPATLLRLRLMVSAESAEVRDRFHALTPGASELTRKHLAEDLAHGGAHWRSTVWLEPTESGAHEPSPTRMTQQAFIEALTALYNRAQHDVLRRADVALRAQRRTAGARRTGLGVSPVRSHVPVAFPRPQ